jgi:hypothetical protein
MVRFMVSNATFNNITVISLRSVLLVEETGVPGENHRPVPTHWQTLSHNVVSTHWPTLSHNVVSSAPSSPERDSNSQRKWW